MKSPTEPISDKTTEAIYTSIRSFVVNAQNQLNTSINSAMVI